MADTASRKWQLTINNPLEHEFTHERIKEELSKLTSLIYYCMSDEQGKEESTLHTHIFLAASSPVRFSTVKNRFPTAHIEQAKGTSQQNRDYIFKAGKWEADEKHGTQIPGTQEEWGGLPLEHPGHRSDFDRAFGMLENGAAVMDVIRADPGMLRYKSMLEQTRQEIIEEEYRKQFRKLTVTYISGATALGKTRFVMEKHGYENVCHITGYQHGCFDKYKCEPVILFDEFHSSLKIQDMLNYLDGYPLDLPCRYTNRVACYDTVYIASNIPLEHQYPNVRFDSQAVWNAFVRRIDRVLAFMAPGEFDEFTREEYLAPCPRAETWQEIPDCGGLPF